MAGTILFCLQWCTSSKLSIVVHLLKMLNYFRLLKEKELSWAKVKTRSVLRLSCGCPEPPTREWSYTMALLENLWHLQHSVSCHSSQLWQFEWKMHPQALSFEHLVPRYSGLSWSLDGESRSLKGRGRGRALVFMAHRLPIPSDFCSTNCKEGNFCLSPIQKLGIPSLWLRRETYPSSKTRNEFWRQKLTHLTQKALSTIVLACIVVEVRPCEAELWTGELSWGKNAGQFVWKIIWKGGRFTGETVSKPEIGIRLKNSVVTSTWAWKVWEWIMARLHGNISDFWASSILLSQKWEWEDSSWLFKGQWRNAHGVTAEALALNQVHGKHAYSPPGFLSLCSFCCTLSMPAFSLLALAGKGCKRLGIAPLSTFSVVVQ